MLSIKDLNMENPITHYTIFGERNSGTNYLTKVMDHNFNLMSTKAFGFKHWYIKGIGDRGRSNTTTDMECLLPVDNKLADSTLFILIVRDPFSWIESMFNAPHSIRPCERHNISRFIRQYHYCKELVCPFDHGPESASPWTLDPISGDYFIEEAENIVDIRNRKNQHFLQLRGIVKHFWIVCSEHLKFDISAMKEHFNLQLKTDQLDLIGYRTPIKRCLLTKKDRQFICSQLNNSLDQRYYG
jgi:hypothetical protein